MSPGIWQAWHGIFLRPYTDPLRPGRVSQTPRATTQTLPAPCLLFTGLIRNPARWLLHQRNTAENIKTPCRRTGEWSRCDVSKCGSAQLHGARIPRVLRGNKYAPGWHSHRCKCSRASGREKVLLCKEKALKTFQEITVVYS